MFYIHTTFVSSHNPEDLSRKGLGYKGDGQENRAVLELGRGLEGSCFGARLTTSRYLLYRVPDLKT